MNIEDLGRAAEISVRHELLPTLDQLSTKDKKLELIYIWVRAGRVSKDVFKFLVDHINLS